MPGRYFSCKYCKKLVYRDSKRIQENKRNGWRVFCSQECLHKSKIKQKIYVCARLGCKKTFIRTPGDFKKTKRCFCSISCSAIYNNHLRAIHRNKFKVVKKCEYCKIRNLKYGKKYCSPKCQSKGESISKEKILAFIHDFEKREGRIPFKCEYTHYHAARLRFGNWNNAVKAAGFSPNPVMFANRHIAKDGHECDSFTEKIIDDWMSEKGIEHKRDVPYPGKNHFTCDFVIGNKWIEFFGLAGELKRYDLLKRRKLNLVRKYGINLIKLFPNDIFPKNKLSLILQ